MYDKIIIQLLEMGRLMNSYLYNYFLNLTKNIYRSLLLIFFITMRLYF